MSKKSKIVIIIASAVVLIIVISVAVYMAGKDRIVVQTGKVERKEILEAIVSAPGEIRAKEFVDLQSEIPGVITELFVKEGDVVKRGDILLKIDPVQTAAEAHAAEAQVTVSSAEAKTQEMQIASAESNHQRDEYMLRSTRAELDQARAHLNKSKSTFERNDQLYEQKLVSREAHDIALADLETARSQYEAARAKVSQLETQLKTARLYIEQMKSQHAGSLGRLNQGKANLVKAKDLLNKTTIYSPLSGIITKLNVERGERAVPGMMFNPQATLMTIANMSTVEVELKVDETDIVNLSLGDKARVKVDALGPDRVIEAAVTEIGSSPITKQSSSSTSSLMSSSQEAKDFKVRAELKDPPKELRPGLSATADITTKVKKDVLTIPLQALTVREVSVDASGKYIPAEIEKTKDAGSLAASTEKKTKKKELQGVFIVGQDRVARFRPVKAGIIGGTDIEIIDGVTAGEEIVSGRYKVLRTLKEQAKVKVDNSSLDKTGKEEK